MTKRSFDVVFSALGFALLWPVFVIVAVLIKVDDCGSVLYRQTRVGLFSRPFKILKFRTMREGADKIGPSITARSDLRVTRIGRWLRLFKLDELPQLWNVLKGEMSFVGPRPEVPKYTAVYTAEQAKVLQLKPGITDEASLEFRNEEELLAAAADPEKYYIEYCIPRKISLNMAYAKEANVFRDLLVILRTIWSMWLHRKSS